MSKYDKIMFLFANLKLDVFIKRGLLSMMHCYKNINQKGVGVEETV